MLASAITWHHIDAFAQAMVALPPAAASLSVATASLSDDIGLYLSPTTNRYFIAVGASYLPLVEPWRNYFQRRGAAITQLANVAALQAFKGRVLVIPDAVALDSQERALLSAYVAHGGNVLADWALGTRGGDGAWVGYDFANQLLKIRIDHVLPADAPRFAAIFGDAPIAHSLPAGQKAWLGQIAEAPLAATGAPVAARYVDAAYQNKSGAVDGAVLYDESDDRRRVYFGFSSASWRFDTASIDALLDDSLGWLAHRPNAWIAAWPDARHAAQIIEMDAQGGFENISRLSDMMRGTGARASFFLLSSEALKYPEQVRAVARANEIAFLGDTYERFSGQPYATQLARIGSMIAALRTELTGFDAYGFRAPYEDTDATTERVLIESGLTYLLAGLPSTQARMPFISPKAAPGANLVVLPRTQLSDANLLKAPTNLLREAVIGDSNAVWEMGGLGVLSIQSWTLTADSPLTQVLPAYLDQVVAQRARVWLAPAGDVAAWWRSRGRASLSIASGVLTIDIVDAPVTGLTVLLPNARVGTASALVGVSGGDGSAGDAAAVANPSSSAGPDMAATPTAYAFNDYETAFVFPRLAAGAHRFQLAR